MMGSLKLMKHEKMKPYLKELPAKVRKWWETKHRRRYSIVMRPNPADVDPENEINICPQVMHKRLGFSDNANMQAVRSNIAHLWFAAH